jgi:2-keto-4-pentenoate hydratase/2-oxohepta-3-ene-1,7-dioic acid hydratase in catechol pathway
VLSGERLLDVISRQIDYEAELAVVIGRRCRRVSEAEALAHVFGYTLINDVFEVEVEGLGTLRNTFVAPGD